MRTIDADALLNEINERYKFYSSVDDPASAYVAATLSYVADAIKEAPTIEPDHIAVDERKIADLHKIVNYLLSQPEQRWIPVTERLPRDDEDVIVTCLDDSGDTPYSYTTVAWHYKGMWVCDNMRCLFVIAWMPLPKPYAKRSKE